MCVSMYACMHKCLRLGAPLCAGSLMGTCVCSVCACMWWVIAYAHVCGLCVVPEDLVSMPACSCLIVSG